MTWWFRTGYHVLRTIISLLRRRVMYVDSSIRVALSDFSDEEGGIAKTEG